MATKEVISGYNGLQQDGAHGDAKLSVDGTMLIGLNTRIKRKTFKKLILKSRIMRARTIPNNMKKMYIEANINRLTPRPHTSDACIGVNGPGHQRTYRYDNPLLVTPPTVVPVVKHTQNNVSSINNRLSMILNPGNLKGGNIPLTDKLYVTRDIPDNLGLTGCPDEEKDFTGLITPLTLDNKFFNKKHFKYLRISQRKFKKKFKSKLKFKFKPAKFIPLLLKYLNGPLPLNQFNISVVVVKNRLYEPDYIKK